MESLLIITGTMGTGKTSVLGEASDILAMRQITHAAIDVDALGLAHLPAGACNDAVMYDNLRSIRKNYAALGVQRFLLARAIEDRAQLGRCREIFPTTNTVVCRLTATIAAMERRIEMRETGISQREYVARVAKLNAMIDRAGIEDFTVANSPDLLTRNWLIIGHRAWIVIANRMSEVSEVLRRTTSVRELLDQHIRIPRRDALSVINRVVHPSSRD